MKSFEELTIGRRSIRKYKSDSLKPEEVRLLLQAGLIAPTSKNKKPCYFISVEDKEKLAKLSNCKRGGCRFVSESPLAIIIGADPHVSDVWIEDAAIAATYIQLQAEALELGSCWIQIRDRETPLGGDSGEFIREIIDAPMSLQILAIITVGYKDENKPPHELGDLPWECVRIDSF